MRRFVMWCLAATVLVASLLVAPLTAHAIEGCDQQSGSTRSNQWKTSVGKTAPTNEDCNRSSGGIRGEQVGDPSPPPNGDTEGEKKSQGKESAAKSPISDDYKRAYAKDDPDDGPGQWAKASAQAAQGVAKYLADELDGLGKAKLSFDREFLTLYSIMFGLGWLVAVAATLVATSKMADRQVSGRQVAQHAYTRLILFSPVAAVLPLLIAHVGDISSGLSTGFLAIVKVKLIESLMAIVAMLGTLTAAAAFIPGGAAVAAGVCAFLAAAMLGVILELTIAKFLVYLLALLLPILFAASINPKWVGGVKKVIGGLLAALLAAPALFLVWAAVGSRMPSPRTGGSYSPNGQGMRRMRWEEVQTQVEGVANKASAVDLFTDLLVFIAGLLVALAAPIAIGLIISYVVPAFAQVSDSSGKVRGAIQKAAGSVRGRSGGGGSGSEQSVKDRVARANRGSEIAANHKGSSGPPASAAKGAGKGTAAKGTAASGTAASGTAASGASMGPVGAAVAAFAAVAGRTFKGLRGSQSRVGAAAERGQNPSREGGSESAAGAGQGSGRGQSSQSRGPDMNRSTRGDQRGEGRQS